MNIKTIQSVYFSPTESTKKIVSIIGKFFFQPIKEIDITCYSERNKEFEFTEEELVIFGMPVYGGRLPVPAAETIEKIYGNQTPAVIFVTYGNRDYDDALLELKNIVEKNGFIVVGCAAIVTEHSIMHSVAHGRPDEDDVRKIKNFAKKVCIKTTSDFNISNLPELNVKGKIPYRTYDGVPFKPKATNKCTKCGICAKNCPVNAIPINAPNSINFDVCISCMRCMKVCPIGARKLNKIVFSLAEKSFAKKYAERRESEFFV